MIERSNAGNGPDDVSDRDVRKAFKALSTEKTPARLDREVLDGASGAASAAGLQRYYRMKPLAWAAILVLTVGIVLELQQADKPAPEAVISERDMASRPDSDVETAGTDSTPASRFADPPDEATGEETVAASPEPARLKQAKDGDSAALPASDQVKAISQAIEDAEAQADQRDNSVGLSNGLAARSIERGETREAQPRHCGEAETADPSSWYQCILELEKEGKTEQASEERSRLLTEFPEFELR